MRAGTSRPGDPVFDPTVHAIVRAKRPRANNLAKALVPSRFTAIVVDAPNRGDDSFVSPKSQAMMSSMTVP
jgi:hypothetical protein